MPLNASWFREKLSLQGLTQRKFAKVLDVDPSAVTLLLRGERQLQPNEIAIVAKTFHVSIEEVMLNAGLSTPNFDHKRTLPIRGYIDGRLTVYWEPPKGPKLAPYPIGQGGKHLKVLRVVADGISPIASLNRALVYFHDVESVSQDVVDRVCIVKISGSKHEGLRVVKRGYDTGHYNLHRLDGTLMDEDVILDRANPVVWIKLG